MAKYNIGGVIFNDEASAKKAAKELKAVEYVLQELKDADENEIYKAYKKLIDQHIFTTQIGLGFLKQLHDNLLETGDFTAENLPAVYDVSADEINFQKKLKEINTDSKVEERMSDVNNVGQNSPAKKTQISGTTKSLTYTENEIKRLKLFNSILIVLVIALFLCVVGMFYVSFTINSPTILNYEQELIDKYSSWEMELTERENAIREKELTQ